MLDFFEDIAAEQAVIGGLLLDQSKALDICEMLKPDDFSRPSHKLIFQVIYDLNEQQIKSDVVTVQSSLNERGQLSQIGGLHYLAELAQNTPSAANIKHYATTVADLSKLAQIGSELREAQNALLGDEDAKDRINNAYSIISDIGQDETDKGERSFNEIQTELARELERRSQLGGGLTGVSTGFEDLDKRFNGLQKTDLIILAARPAMGKTTLAINIAQEVAKQKHVAIFSMEMSAEQITEKIWASLGGGFKLKDIKQGNLDTDYSSYLLANISEAKKLRIDIDDRGALTPQQVRARCLRLKRKHGELGLVVIDYLQLMQVNGSGQNRTQEITKISGALKALAKELECPVIALSQLNRSVEQRTKKIPSMSDLRESGSIEQDADIIMFCYRDDYYAEIEGRQSDEQGIARIITGKYRGGEVGTDYLKTEFRFSRFRNCLGYEPPEETPTTRTTF